MIVDATYIYAAEIRRRRRRTGENVQIADVVPVEIEELGSDEAPVAAWFTPEHIHYDHQIALRCHDGEFYEPVVMDDKLECPELASEGFVRPNPDDRFDEDETDPDHEDAPSSPPLPVHGAQAVALLAALPVRHRDRGTFRAEAGRNLSDVAGMDDLASVTAPRRDEYAQHAVRWFSELKLIDGVLHRRVGCPLIVCDPDRASLSYGYVENDAISSVHRTAFSHRIDRFDDAIEELALRTGDPAIADSISALPISGRPEIVRPEMFTFDDTGYAVRRCAQTILHKLELTAVGNDRHRYGYLAPYVATFDLEVLTAYAGLRDAVAAEADEAVLLEVLERFHAAAHRQGLLMADAKAADAVLQRARREGRCGNALADGSDELANLDLGI